MSPGYDGDAVLAAGIWKDGERFDAQQTARTYNHLAFAKRGQRGRCSSTCGGGPCLCAARADAEGAAMDDALMELCLKAYPDDAKGALQAYKQCMAQMGKAPEEKPAEEPKADADDEKPPGEPMVRADAIAAAVAAATAPLRAQVAAAEKALERQTRSHADSVGKNIGLHLEALERFRVTTGARADSVGGMTVDQMDRASLTALYPEDEKEIAGYSAVELAAHVKQAFHPTRGDHRVRAARENGAGAHADAIGAGSVRPGGKGTDEWSKALELERKFNGQAS